MLFASRAAVKPPASTVWCAPMRMDKAAGPRPRGRIPALVALLCVLAAGVPAAAAADWPGPDGAYDWPGMKKCGSFPSSYRIYVYAGKGPAPAAARRGGS